MARRRTVGALLCSGLVAITALGGAGVRWVADHSGLCAVEMSSTGLPQDEQALLAILDKASETVVRRDRPLDAERQPN